jgi:hypothetical protein
MYSPITSTDLFQFTQPEHRFGQKVKTEDGYIGYIVGLDFYPEISSWVDGVYLPDHNQELPEEIWYEASQLKVLNSAFDTLTTQLMWSDITNIKLFQFTQPEYRLGQKVKTEDSYIGYIVGLDFYPKTNTWSYGVYLFNRKQELIEEIWYETAELSRACLN